MTTYEKCPDCIGRFYPCDRCEARFAKLEGFNRMMASLGRLADCADNIEGNVAKLEG